ncbi:hypothetical protein DUNSADRAFT_10150 [Dunaliella salina]|nr:hypothetical protein DUNSADRAFT_10150 [Dunaliella salina]|eukprot:KAF5833538.1 hypothetical protein DUNSADRAFT_10150 [Dunaliella salina]
MEGVDGSGHQDKALFDAAMRSGLAPLEGRTAHIKLQDVVIYNLCSMRLPFKPPEIYSIDQDNFYLLPRGRELQNYERENATVYLTNQVFLGLVNWLVLDTTPFQAIHERWADWVLQLAPQTDAVVSDMQEFSMTLEHRKSAGGVDRNVTVHATNNPNDPHGLKLPEFGGDLMPHRFCAPDGSATGPLMSPENVFDANFTFAPTWMISGSEQLSKLDNVSAWGINPTRVGGKIPPALAVFVRDASFAAKAGEAANSTFVHTDTLFHGPLSNSRPTIDFAMEMDFFLVFPFDMPWNNHSCFMQALIGLKNEPIEDREVTGKRTSLQLVGIDRLHSRAIKVAHVTLQVAKLDFLALLSAALRGERWQSGATSTAYLLTAIDVFQPAEFNRSSLKLSEFSGWGIKGTDVQFVPSSPLLESDILLDQDSSSSSTDNAVALGVGIGVGVGGGLLLISILTALAVVYKRRKRMSQPPSFGKYFSTDIAPYSTDELRIAISQHKGESGEAAPKSKASGTSGNSIPQKIAMVPLSLRGSYTLGQPLKEVHLQVDSLPIQKIVADQIPKDPYMLVRREVLFTEHTEGHLPQKARAVLEAAVSASMSHPNIVSTYHFDIKQIQAHHGGIQVDAMAGIYNWKLEGKPLMQRILILLLEVASGMSYLHNRQIIHSDLKPENVLLKADPSSRLGITAKIADFGLAANLGPHATHASNVAGGTQYYVAPEVAIMGRTSKASDVYSFGVIMVEVYSKTPPWVKVNGIYSINPSFPSFPPDMPQPYTDLAFRCLELDSKARPRFQEIESSLQDMLDDLERPMHGDLGRYNN